MIWICGPFKTNVILKYFCYSYLVIPKTKSINSKTNQDLEAAKHFINE